MDTWVILSVHSTAKQGYKSDVVRTPDGDIFLILLTIRTSQFQHLDTVSTFDKNQIFNVTELAKSLIKEKAAEVLHVLMRLLHQCLQWHEATYP